MEDAQLCQTEFMIEICEIEMKFCRFSEILIPIQRPLLGLPRIRAAQINSNQSRVDKVFQSGSDVSKIFGRLSYLEGCQSKIELYKKLYLDEFFEAAASVDNTVVLYYII